MAAVKELWSQLKIAVLAKLYDTNSGFQYAQGKNLIDNHMSIDAGQNILDLGCGTGRLASYVSSIVGPEGRVIGVDPNKERLSVAEKALATRTRLASLVTAMVASASEGDAVEVEPNEEEPSLVEKALTTRHPNIKFVEGKIDDVTKYGPFDGVICNFVLHWLSDAELRPTLQTLFNNMKAGARVCVTVSIYTGKMADDFCHMLHGTDEATLAGYSSQQPEYWRNVFESVGFKVELCQKTDAPFRFETAKKYFDTLKAYTEGKVDINDLSQSDREKLFKDHGIADMESPLDHVGEMGVLVVCKPSV